MLTCCEIAKLLPHRFPMLLIDCVLDFTASEFLVASKCITINEICYRRIGSDPNMTDFSYPYPLIIESFSQAAALLAVLSLEEEAWKGKTMILGVLKSFRFMQEAFPGDTVIHHVKLESKLDNSIVISGSVKKSNGELVATSEREIILFK